MTTQTASAMLKEIAALETFSETTRFDDGETIVQTYEPFIVVVLLTTIQLHVISYRNGKNEGYFTLSLKPNARVKQFLIKSGLTFTRRSRLASDVPGTRLAELKEYLLDAARYEKLKALLE